MAEDGAEIVGPLEGEEETRAIKQIVAPHASRSVVLDLDINTGKILGQRTPEEEESRKKEIDTRLQNDFERAEESKERRRIAYLAQLKARKEAEATIEKARREEERKKEFEEYDRRDRERTKQRNERADEERRLRLEEERRLALEKERKIRENGYEVGRELSCVFNTQTGRDRIELWLNLAVQDERTLFTNLDEARRRILMRVDSESTSMNENLSSNSRVRKEWRRSMGIDPKKAASSDYYPAERDFINETFGSINLTRRYKKNGLIPMSLDPQDNWRHSKLLSTERALHDEGFIRGWEEIEASETQPEKNPWYIPSSEEKY